MTVPQEPYFVDARGNTIFLLRPEDSVVDPYAIAHALARINRFNGHARYPYSVAEHSVHVAHLLGEQCGPEGAAVGLLHDAHEAYTGDMASPIKRCVPGWEAFEQSWEHRVRAALGGMPSPFLVGPLAHADHQALMTERHYLIEESPAWPDRPELIDHEWFLERPRRVGRHRGHHYAERAWLDCAKALGVLA